MTEILKELETEISKITKLIGRLEVYDNEINRLLHEIIDLKLDVINQIINNGIVNIHNKRNKPEKTRISDWLKTKYVSIRLSNILTNIARNNRALYIEDVDEKMLRNTRGCGVKSIREFRSLTNINQ